ncbi:YiiX/YebB-like N1pC/P60 family cysteine hydrolase [Salinicola sp. JS01]|uniref:YiiX/YebB-like N1pC/P60 family cysteine hydrolase n=1 Tax=Salinicola sp. JS01 TaxID=3050071 RepID=UPI00255BD4B8|nr:YiiX/YebB-like N1pC/P60 family cysteine hydrolase [Salinicola sp. JS01]WIX35068.1 YiiX/YebB-like N1pC/P60 family cysteine hydrolase [Salinicola sp. JS01]
MTLGELLKPADVVLVDGNRRISTAIKYLTQSTWSHAAIYIGRTAGTGDQPAFVEADVETGVHVVGLDSFAGLQLRLCRPIGLTQEDAARVVAHVCERIGNCYDLKNVFDLLRYLLPTPPVPSGWRRRMLALGSGDPTRAICSSLIAEAFQSVRFPILPLIELLPELARDCDDCLHEQWHIRHHSLFVPRDFDVSPYFAIIKPNTSNGFDYHALPWDSSGIVSADSSLGGWDRPGDLDVSAVIDNALNAG